MTRRKSMARLRNRGDAPDVPVDGHPIHRASRSFSRVRSMSHLASSTRELRDPNLKSSHQHGCELGPILMFNFNRGIFQVFFKEQGLSRRIGVEVFYCAHD